MRNIFLAVSMVLAAPMLVGANGNWETTVAETDGGHLMGNPEAKVKLTEWVSYTCPHCAQYEHASSLRKSHYIRHGRIAVEIRHYIRDPIDVTIAMITNCLPDSKFFATHSAFLLSQERWMAKARATNRAQQQRWTSGAIPARLRAVANDLDFYEFMEGRGIGRTELDRCLADETRVRAIANQSQADIQKFSLAGTPSFAINGKLANGVHDWSAVQKALEDVL